MKFRMIDRITGWEMRASIRGMKTVSFEEYQLKWAWAGEPCLPESLLMESLFQLGNWLIMLSSDFREMGLLLRFQEVRFLAPAGPGASLAIEAEVLRYRGDGITFKGWARVGEKKVIEGDGCLATPVALADYYDPDDLKVLYSEIFRPD